MKTLLALALGATLATITLEGVSRWYFYYCWITDPILGDVVPAGHTVRSRREGAGIAHFESNGVRRAADLGPRIGTQLLCIGDSFSAAFQVSDDEVYTALVERALDERGLSSAVLNLSHGGRSLADYISGATTYTAAFAPTWTVVQIQDIDVGYDAWEVSKTHFLRRCERCPLEIVRVDRPHEGAVRRGLRRLRNRSAFVSLWVPFGLQLSSASRGGGKQQEDNQQTEGPSAARYPVEEELQLLQSAYHGRLTVLLLGRFNPDHPGLDTEGEAAVKQAARDLGISIVCSKDEYAALAEQGVAPYGFANTALNTGHMNAAGHAAAARVLTRELLRLHRDGRF